jgi:transcription initiation factor TFIIH subunit 1
MATAGAGPPPSGSAAYKKKDGVLSMSSDFQSVAWKPKAAGDTGDGALTISVKDITSAFWTLV